MGRKYPAGTDVTLNRYDLACLPKAIAEKQVQGRKEELGKSTGFSLAQAIDAFGVALYSAEDGTTYQVPDFTAQSGLDLNQALRTIASVAVERSRAELEQAITALWLLSGKTVSVRRDGAYGNTVLDLIPQRQLKDDLIR